MIQPHYNTAQTSSTTTNNFESGRNLASIMEEASNILANMHDTSTEDNLTSSLTPSNVKNNKRSQSEIETSNKKNEKKNDTQNNVISDDEEEEPKGKRRKVGKKPMDMPRRALSAYNIFFSEQRNVILKEIERKEQEQNNEGDGDNISIGTSTSSSVSSVSSDTTIRQPGAIPILSQRFNMNRTKRLHRKVHGKISLVVLAREVSKRWKALSDEDRKYYKDLAAEDKIRHTQAMREYKQRKAEEAMMIFNQEQQQKQQKQIPLMYSTMQMEPINVPLNPLLNQFQFQQHQKQQQMQHHYNHPMFTNFVAGQQPQELHAATTFSTVPATFSSTVPPSYVQQPQQPYVRSPSPISSFDTCPSNVMPLTNMERMMILKCRAEAANVTYNNTQMMMQQV